MPRSQLELELVRPWSRRRLIMVLRFAIGAITLTTLMPARPMATTGLAGSLAASSSASVPGTGGDGAMAGADMAIAAATDIAGVTVTAVDTPADIAADTRAAVIEAARSPMVTVAAQRTALVVAQHAADSPVAAMLVAAADHTAAAGTAKRQRHRI